MHFDCAGSLNLGVRGGCLSSRLRSRYGAARIFGRGGHFSWQAQQKPHEASCFCGPKSTFRDRCKGSERLYFEVQISSRSSDFVTGAALCEPQSADFVAGPALCALSCSHLLSLSHAHSHSHSHSLTLTVTRTLTLTHCHSHSHSPSRSRSRSLSLTHTHSHSHSHSATITTISTFITTITSPDPTASRSLDFLLPHL